MNYWDLRTVVSKLVPRMGALEALETAKEGLIKEKGRKTNYHQFSLDSGQFEKQERLLNTEEMNSFLEVSLRAMGCPMCLNLDVWDGLYCPHRCQYCYADAFRASLYTSFFDNARSMGLRSCNPSYFRGEMDKLLGKYWKQTYTGNEEVPKAISLGMPIRFGIRFEDFMLVEAKERVALNMLQYLRDAGYPVMVNTKGSVIGEDDYVRALADNAGRGAVHITMISSDEEFLKKIEPGAPPFALRIWAAKQLVDAGIRVVARIEPFMVFLNDSRDMVEQYVHTIRSAGIEHITFDTYSYSAYNPGIRANFMRLGFDFDRMFNLMSSCQWMGSLLLGKFIDYLRGEGFQCSTFDLGNVPKNNDTICCEVGSYFDSGFSYGNAVGAVRYISAQGGTRIGWREYEDHVIKNGGWLSSDLRQSVRQLWNMSGNDAYSLDWAAGLKLCGCDREGLLWAYDAENDFREEMLKGVL